jgi:predicted secreted hydrolase
MLIGLLTLLGIGISAAVFGLLQPPSAAQAPSSTLVLATPAETPDFARALEPRTFSFPADHGPHTEYQTEWWYYTGNLESQGRDHYGYQLTFFRRGLSPQQESRGSDLATTQIYFAHFAITDVRAGKHVFVERFSRGTPALAGASGDPYAVWLEAWRVDSLDAAGDKVHLQASHEDMHLDLTLTAVKPITLQGNRGLSSKGGMPGNASYYLSFTRMRTAGSIGLGDVMASVTGTSWFDHEWSTSALPERAVGWDWFSLQLDDGRDAMLFRIRDADGSIDPSASGTLVDAAGNSHPLSAEDFSLEERGTWRGPETGGVYPVRWQVSIPSAGLDLVLEPWLDDQEMRVSFPYWEGAVKIVDSSTGQVVGQGYVELTGYAASLQGTF